QTIAIEERYGLRLLLLLMPPIDRFLFLMGNALPFLPSSNGREDQDAALSLDLISRFYRPGKGQQERT
ncbi:unnamed protein product, partial [Musa textilis]